MELRARLAHVPRLITRNIAIADQTGSLEFSRSSYDQSSSARRMTAAHRKAFPKSAASERITIECSTLDGALEAIAVEDPLLVKMDVQGFEDKVIAGGQRTLARSLVLWVETSFEELYEGQPLFSDIHDQLRRLGFEFHGNHSQLMSPRTDAVLQADSIFLRSGMRFGLC
jgi:FkbM family methyltransferase